MTVRRMTKEPQFNLLQKITLFLLILAGMDFFSQYRTIAFAACIMFLFLKMRFVFDTNVLWLLLLAISWVVFSPSMNSVSAMIAPFVFPLAYCAGLNFLPTNDQPRAEKNFRTAVIAVSTGPFAHFLLNFLFNLGKDVERNTYDFWTKDVLSATGQAPLALMMLAAVVIMLFTNARPRIKVWSVIILVAIFVYNLTLAGRTLFVMLMLIFAVSLLFLILKGERNSKKYKTLLIIVLIILMLTILYNSNAFGIKDSFESSNFYNRFFGQWGKDLDEDSRMEKKLNYLQDFGKSFWGGLHLRPLYGYAHDILLDTYDEAGILALIAMLVFLISSVIRMFSCIANKMLKFETKQWILGIYVAILVQFMVEPVLQGIPWMFMLFCFIHGMVTGLDKRYKGETRLIN